MEPIGASRSWRWYGYQTSWITLDGRRIQVVSGGGHWGGGRRGSIDPAPPAEPTEPVPRPAAVGTGVSLAIASPTPAHSGRYWCEAKDQRETVQSNPCELVIAERSGHSALEPEITSHLVEATERFRATV